MAGGDATSMQHMLAMRRQKKNMWQGRGIRGWLAAVPLSCSTLQQVTATPQQLQNKSSWDLRPLPDSFT